MNYALSLIFLTYVLQVNIDPGSALKCYKCKAGRGEYYACEHKPTPRQVPAPKCEGDQDVCLILKVRAQSVNRKCAKHDYCSGVFNASGRLSCHMCNFDLCNSGANGEVVQCVDYCSLSGLPDCSNRRLLNRVSHLTTCLRC